VGFPHQTGIEESVKMIGVEKSTAMKVLSQIVQRFVHNGIRNNIRNPKYRWFLIAASLIYLVSPLDISPDFLPVLGWLDDGMIVTLLASEFSQFVLDRRKARKDAVTETAVDRVNQTITVDSTVVG
jgi:uncharacterized membrane protein YkvA (DUF1232 family)